MAALPCAAMLAVALAMSGAIAGPGTEHRTYRVVINKMAYGTLPRALHPGDTIKWVNRDLFRHTVSARNRSFDIDLPPGKSATMALKRVGSTAFFCRFHPGMKGVIRVIR